MRRLLADVDQLLRGRFTEPAQLRSGRIEIPARNLAIASLAMGIFYGIFMGLYGATRPKEPAFSQLVATSLKVPLLFLLTLFVTLPSLYVLSALAGSRLDFRHTLRMLLAAIAINLAVLASLGPVTGFFTLSTSSYPFMVVLNVLFFAAAGVGGLVFLRRALVHVFAAPIPSERRGGDSDSDQASAASAGSATSAASAGRSDGRANRGVERDRGLVVFRAWLVVYGVVGAQMGWVLRPFIGSPDEPFTLFRARESHFLEGVLRALGNLFS